MGEGVPAATLRSGVPGRDGATVGGGRSPGPTGGTARLWCLGAAFSLLAPPWRALPGVQTVGGCRPLRWRPRRGNGHAWRRWPHTRGDARDPSPATGPSVGGVPSERLARRPAARHGAGGGSVGLAGGGYRPPSRRAAPLAEAAGWPTWAAAGTGRSAPPTATRRPWRASVGGAARRSAPPLWPWPAGAAAAAAALREKIPGYPAGSKRFSLTATGDVLGLYHPSLSAAFRSRGHNDGTRSRKKAGSDGTLIGSQHSSRHCQPCLD